MKTEERLSEVVPERLEDADGPPFVEGVIPGTMSGAEMIEFWRRNGVFEAFAARNAEIGPGKRFADSTEYVHYLREQSALEAPE